MKLHRFPAPLLLALLIGAQSPAAFADLIASWDVTGEPGNQTSQASNASAPNVTGSAITRVGVSAASASNSFSASGWNGGAAANPADDSKYISFGFTISPNFKVDLQSLVIATRSSPSGPGTMGLFYSGNAFATAIHTFNQGPGDNVVNSTVDLSTLMGLEGAIEFRVIEIGNTQADGVGGTLSAGIFRLAENGVDISFNGTVVAVPEPTAFLFGSLICGVVGGNYLRKRMTMV